MSVYLILIFPAVVLASIALLEGVSFFRARLRSRKHSEDVRESDRSAVDRARQEGSFKMKAGPLPDRGSSRDVDLYQVTPMSGGQNRNPNAALDRATGYLRQKGKKS
ncbi:MAG: hypothetical protein K8J08_20625 [Thermoanaerobaculia bacterium]|nr:hypothetical protein [Thermoanaerobaculia bacterium]